MGVRTITNSFEVEIDLYNELFAYDTNGLTTKPATVSPRVTRSFHCSGPAMMSAILAIPRT